METSEYIEYGLLLRWRFRTAAFSPLRTRSQRQEIKEYNWFAMHFCRATTADILVLRSVMFTEERYYGIIFLTVEISLIFKVSGYLVNFIFIHMELFNLIPVYCTLLLLSAMSIQIYPLILYPRGACFTIGYFPHFIISLSPAIGRNSHTSPPYS